MKNTDESLAVDKNKNITKFCIYRIWRLHISVEKSIFDYQVRSVHLHPLCSLKAAGLSPGLKRTLQRLRVL